jgi:CRISPR-associated protein Cas2
MFRILVYDVQVSRVSKVRRYLSDKLFWTQNSTFEGFLSEPQKTIVLQQLSSFLDPEEDSILVFSTEADYSWEKRMIGIEKNTLGNLFR